MKNKKLVLGLMVAAVIGALAVFGGGEGKTNQTEPSPGSEKNEVRTGENNFVLPTYPIDQIPLFKLSKISSFKLFNNTDPKNTSIFDETDFTYYNVVFDTQASQEEFLTYYTKLFDQKVDEEYSSNETVKGVVGDYKVKATHYGEDTKTGYLEVHTGKTGEEALSGYYQNYAPIIEEGQYLVEHERSYGLLNQNGGEVEYTKYFTIADTGDQDQDGQDDTDEIGAVEAELTAKFAGKPKYTFDQNSGTITFEEGEYKVTVVVSRNHRRVYLMQRKSMAEK